MKRDRQLERKPLHGGRESEGGGRPRPQAAEPLNLNKQHYPEGETGFHRENGLPAPDRFQRFRGYALRGRWVSQAGYAALRNAAWMVRNSRVGQANNPLALRVVVVEVVKLVEAGEDLSDVMEALCELLVHP